MSYLLLLDAVGFLSALAWLCASTLVVHLQRSLWSSSLREWPRAPRRRRSRICFRSILLSLPALLPDGLPRPFLSVPLRPASSFRKEWVRASVSAIRSALRSAWSVGSFIPQRSMQPRTISRCPMKFAWSSSRTSSSGPDSPRQSPSTCFRTGQPSCLRRMIWWTCFSISIRIAIRSIMIRS